MAVRISGIVLPQDKRFVIALTYLHGIGLSTSEKILKAAGIPLNTRTKDLTENQVNEVRNIIKSDNIKIENDLRREVMGNIKRLREIKCYRGIRHDKGLPVRGQRTKTNQRTRKGNKRVTLGSGRTKESKT